MNTSRPASILVVEDEAIVARDLQRTLADLDYDVQGTAASGDEAIVRACERCPDLVLMDVRIQGQLDGIETAELLRSRFRVPVVFLTAYADEATVERAKRVEPYGYLLKPIKSQELRSAVEVALYKHGRDTQLRDRERWFATTLRSIGDAVISTDVFSRVTFMNSAAEEMTGWRSDHAIGRPLDDVLRSSREAGKCAFENPAGRAVPIRDRGDVLGSVMVFRDEDLERDGRLSDRLASVRTMAAGISQELTDPLVAVASNVDAVANALARHRAELRSLFSEEAYASVFKGLDDIQRRITAAGTGASRASSIVAELRTLSSPAATRPVPVDVRRVLSWAGEVVAHEIRARASLSMEIGQVPPVAAEEGRLGQVFVNLLLNAAQAIPPGNVKAHEVRVTGRTAPDGRASIEFRDTGCGIPRDLMGRIFEPFFSTRSGTGLGLSICHGIVKSLGGEITVESEAGKGSIFRVLLPPAAGAPAAPGVETAAVPGRVLVIDDDDRTLSAIRGVLAPPHETICVKTVREASALIERGERFDVVLCGLLLPRVSGMDFYDELLASRPDLARRVIFMTGGSFTPRAVEFVGSVSNRCLEKPFSALALRSAVGAVISAS